MSEPACHWSLGEGVPSNLGRGAPTPVLPGLPEYLAPGDRLCGDYEVVGVLGTGASGVVYRAREPGTGRDVAIKLLSRDVDPVLCERLLREGQTVAKLQHPGIARVFSAGRWDESPFLVYELLEGCRTLEEAFGQTPRRQLLQVVQKIAAALGYAHAQGVVHRDVKPENVLLDEEGAPRLIDFGHARNRDHDRLTTHGVLIGTPLYMAPETYDDSSGSPAADVWSVGVILYRALCGRFPFDAPNLMELAAQVWNVDSKVLRGFCPDQSPAFEAITRRALSVEASARYPDASAMAEDLRRALAGEPLVSRAPVRRAGLLALGVFLVALGGAALAFLDRRAHTGNLNPSPSTLRPLDEEVEAALAGGDLAAAGRLLATLRLNEPSARADVLASQLAAARGSDPMPLLDSARSAWPGSPLPVVEQVEVCVSREAFAEALRRAQEGAAAWGAALESRAEVLEELLRDRPRPARLSEVPDAWVQPVSRWLLKQAAIDLALLEALTPPRSWVRDGRVEDITTLWFLELGLDPAERVERAKARLDLLRSWNLEPGDAARAATAREQLERAPRPALEFGEAERRDRREAARLLQLAGVHQGARLPFIEGQPVEDILTEAIALDPECWPAHYVLARIRFQDGDAQGLRGCLSAVERCPRLIRHFLYTLRLWAANNGPGALHELRTRFEAGDRLDALLRLTLLASAAEFDPAGREDVAIAAWHEAEDYLQRDPGSLLARNLRAFLALRTGRLDECRRELKRLREALVEAPTAELIRALLLMREGATSEVVLSALRAARHADHRAMSDPGRGELQAELYPEAAPYLGIEEIRAFFGA